MYFTVITQFDSPFPDPDPGVQYSFRVHFKSLEETQNSLLFFWWRADRFHFCMANPSWVYSFFGIGDFSIHVVVVPGSMYNF